MGPNVKRLMIERMSQLQVERAKRSRKPGEFLAGAVAIGLLDQEAFKQDSRDAKQWVEDMLRLVRSAPGSDAWPTDEDVAGEVLKQVEERKRQQEAARRGR